MEKIRARLFNRKTGSSGQKAPGLPGRAAWPAIIIFLALMTGGCLVSNEDFDEARLKRDEYRSELQRLHQSNDDLKREISETYDSCDQINTQLTVLAAMAIHDQFTDGLARARPVLPPPIDASPTPPRRRTTPDQGVRTPRGQGTTQSPGDRSGSGGGTRRPPPGGQSGGTSTSPPPARPSGGGGGNGSIDWGF